MNCIVKMSEDPHSLDRGYNTLIYFYGKMIYLDTNRVFIGAYEFFINSRKTLFHRFFRYIQHIPDDILKDISQYL